MSNWSISSSVHRSPSASRRGLTNKHTIYSAPGGTCTRESGTVTPRRAERSSAVERCPIALVQSVMERRARASSSEIQVLVITPPGVGGVQRIGKRVQNVKHNLLLGDKVHYKEKGSITLPKLPQVTWYNLGSS